ncbi:conserved hypothetical protein [Catenulispora acidiphila DSM 44928]|uniref:Helicase HerA central domain-containing protein n=1 Tax=Catenulispora acidiphila (strain DSM 44928 / JCM 14897 / NBRC 102108 / NRRL B-24433 / ID139908) TaxID=479433 RepID=C7Q8F5_CATAD|nr:DUF87 domain-containing protein [Catenulispora acidiphila]ACU76143.1 conserved hypothetical protein [Catenulispora acidiphila DSM 44928]
MASFQGMAAQAVVEANPLTGLLKGARRLGGIYHLDYERAVIITDDLLKRDAGGVPRHGFLLAAATAPNREHDEPLDEDEIILLRVRGVAQLPNQSEVVATRMAAMRDADLRDRKPSEILDTLTEGQIQMSAFECDVLGTFYPESVAGQAFIQYGADIDNVYAGARYFVYTPSAETLKFLASYPQRTKDEIERQIAPALIELGHVRFAATRRRAVAAGLAAVPVNVRVTDFIARKTAVLGMTRAGKSNTNKTICTAIFEYSQTTKRPIGQLIFDPQGEYASVNQQDKTGLRLLGEDWVRIYKLRANPDDQQERSLTINFYDQSHLPAVRGLIEECIGDLEAGYVHAFKAAEIENPDAEDYPGGDKDSAYLGASNRARCGRFALYALLAKAGFKVPSGWSGIRFQMAGVVADAILKDYGSSTLIKESGYVTVKTMDGLKSTMDWLCRHIQAAEKATDRKPYSGPDITKWRECVPFMAIRAAYDGSGGGTAILNRLKGSTDFHDPKADANLLPQVASDLERGMLVIVDLSYGSERVATMLSERLVRGLLDLANKRFRSNQDPMRMQIVVEEAHRLFDRERANKNETDPWVRLAKESAKYEIGVIYATQEVSSVDRRILSNTHNWVIAHLNSDQETRELAHYYDFAVFADEIRRSEEPGFARMKTFSGKYIVPIQIAKFDHDMINGARKASGQAEITVPGQVR